MTNYSLPNWRHGGPGLRGTPSIPGEFKESLERRIELTQTRNFSAVDPNDAEKEYQMIWERETKAYDERSKRY